MTAGREKNKATESWTFLIVGDMGKITSFRLSKAMIAGLAVCLVSAAVLAGLGVWSYHGMRSQQVALRSELDQAKAGLVVATEAKEEAQVRLMAMGAKRSDRGIGTKSVSAEKAEPSKETVARKEPPPQAKPASGTKDAKPVPEKKPIFAMTEAAPVPAEKAEVKPAETNGGEPSEEQDEILSEDDSEADTERVRSAEPAADGLLVDALQLKQEADERSVRFQFSLKNVGADGEKVQGYTFVVLKPDEDSDEPARGSPWTPLKEGEPTIYKRGQFFSIARFKYVRGTIPQIQDVTRFKTATVYVYTESGTLLIEKAFSISDVLKS